MRSLHALREGSSGRSAHPLSGSRQPHRGQHVSRRSVLVVLQWQHRADLSGRRAHGQAVSLQSAPLGSRRGRVDQRCRFRRLAYRGAVVTQSGVAVRRRRQRPGQLGLAERQGAFQLRSARQRGAPYRTTPARQRAGQARRSRRSTRTGYVDPGSRCGRRRAGRCRPCAYWCARWCTAHERVGVRVGQVGQGRHRYRQRRLPVGRWSPG